MSYSGPCFMSGARIFDESTGKMLRVAPHMLQLTVCRNGSLMAKCAPHGVRTFISDIGILRKMRRNYEIFTVDSDGEKP